MTNAAAIEEALDLALGQDDIELDVTKSPVQIASETMGRDLVQVLLQEIRTIPDVWPKLSEQRQSAVIDRLIDRVSVSVKSAVRILAADNRPTIDGMLEQVTVKDGIKAQFKVSQHNPNRHELFDSVNKVCLLVVASAADHLEGMDEIAADPDQPELPIGEELDAEFVAEIEQAEMGFADQSGEVSGHTYADIVVFLTARRPTVSVDYLQSRFALGSDQAGFVIDKLLRNDIIEVATPGSDDYEATYNVSAEAEPHTVSME